MLSSKQKAAAEALYKGEVDEQEIAEQFGVSVSTVQRWLERSEFQEELDRLCRNSLQETRFTISRFGPIAALHLAKLLSSDKEDTVRRAALDMIDRSLKVSGSEAAGTEREEESQISDDEARQMLLKLADGIEEEGD